MDQKHNRNFSIIAHVDHGKSTLADRFIQLCGGLSEREMGAQVLDSMDLERERGITIKAQSVTLDYRARNGETYRLNLSTPPATSIFPTKYPAPWLPAKAPCWSSTPPRGSRRRASPTATPLSSWVSRSFRCSTR